MENPSDPASERAEMWEKLIGLGEQSARKSYYPELQKRLEDLERFRALLDQSHDAIWQIEVSTGLIVDANEAACRWLGREPGMLTGQRVCDIEGLSRIEELGHLLRGERLSGCIVEVELGLSAQQGRVIEMTIHRRAFGAGEYLVAVAHDITARKEVEETLKRTLVLAQRDRDHLNGILGSVADGLLVTDEQGRLVIINAVARQMLGLGEQTQGCALETVLSESGLVGQILAVLTGSEDGGVVDLSIHIGRVGQKGVAQAHSAPVLGGGAEVRGVVTLLRDLSREREFDQAKSDFISRAAHELRTPLTVVRGYAELLMAAEDYGFSSDEFREYLGIICAKSDRLSAITDDLLDLTRIEAGRRVGLECSSFDPQALLAEALEPWTRLSDTHAFELSFSGFDGTLEADRLKLCQVLDNLLSNAVKYSPRGGRIRLVAEAGEQGQLQVSVEDEGRGIAPETRERVFEKFFRVDTSNTAIDGLGLGLTIARSIIAAHGGRIWIEEASGGGTAVRFCLPRSQGLEPGVPSEA